MDRVIRRDQLKSEDEPLMIPVSSQNIDELKGLIIGLKSQYIEPVIFREFLVEETLSRFYSQSMRQIQVFNPTGRTVKISTSGIVDTNHYELVCGANTLIVFPPFLFTQIAVHQDTFTQALINPMLVATNIILPSGRFAL